MLIKYKLPFAIKFHYLSNMAKNDRKYAIKGILILIMCLFKGKLLIEIVCVI